MRSIINNTLKVGLPFPLNFLNSIIKMTSNWKIVRKKLILLVSKKANPMVDDRYDLLATVPLLYFLLCNQHVETSIIQLIVIPLCRVGKVAHDTKTPLKSYHWSDNPNGFSFSNYQQVFINFWKMKYFYFPELTLNSVMASEFQSFVNAIHHFFFTSPLLFYSFRNISLCSSIMTFKKTFSTVNKHSSLSPKLFACCVFLATFLIFQTCTHSVPPTHGYYNPCLEHGCFAYSFRSF